MYKLNTISLILALLFLNGCSIQKKEYQAVGSTINYIKTPFSSKDIDTIEVVDYGYTLNAKVLEGYKIQKDIILNNKLKPSYNFYTWTDKKYSWILSDNEIDLMIKSLKKQKKKLWEKRIVAKKNIILVDLPYYEDNIYEDKDRQLRMKNEKFVYFISKPVFNKNKNIFIIQFKTILLSHVSSVLIFKKEKNKWILIGQN